MYYHIILSVSIALLTYFLLLNSEIIAKNLNLYDFPNIRKIHKKPIPLVGGIIFLIVLREIQVNC